MPMVELQPHSNEAFPKVAGSRITEFRPVVYWRMGREKCKEDARLTNAHRSDLSNFPRFLALVHIVQQALQTLVLRHG